MRRRMLVDLTALAAVLAATTGVAGAATPPERGQVTNAVDIPVTNAQAAAAGRDLDGDRTRDNQLGAAFAALAQQGLDLGAAHDEAVAHGTMVMLHSLRTSSFANTRHATWQVLPGVPSPEPDYTGAGVFVVSTTDKRSARLEARIKNHVVRTVPGRIPIRLDLGLAPSEGALTLPLRKAVVTATCRRTGCTGGRIAGALMHEEITSVMVPHLATTFDLLVERDCPGPEASSCMADSEGKTIQQLFDSNDDLQITAEEVRDNVLISSLLAPDLDLVRSDGSPGQDGEMDALSFGFTFATVPATLMRP